MNKIVNTKKSAQARDGKVKILRGLSKIYYQKTKFELRIVEMVGKLIGQDDLTCNLAMPFAEAIEDTSNCYMTYTYYPKHNKDAMSRLIYRGSGYSDSCIVIQGPIITKNHFTLESVRHYKRIFPDVRIVVSTWRDSPADEIKRIGKEKGVSVVKSEYPEKPGFGNINFQRISALNGVKKAKELGCKYVIKTRSDTRITAEGILEFLRYSIDSFPINENISEQNKRIVFFNCMLFHPYHSSDFFYYGDIDDMIQFFDKELNDKDNMPSIASQIIAEKWTYRKSFEHMGGENEIPIKYFEKILKNGVHCDLNEWWEILGDYIVALPISWLRPIWYKYDYNHEESNLTFSYRRKIFGGRDINITVVDYAMWNDMVQHSFSLNPRDYEYIIDRFWG